MTQPSTSLVAPPGPWRVPTPGSERHARRAQEFSSAFEHAAIGMVLLAPDSRRLQVNPAYCQMLGYRADQLLSAAVTVTHPQDAGGERAARARCLAGQGDTYWVEKRYVHRDGHLIWAHQTGRLVRDAQGAPLHFICQVQDITERKHAERALRESEARFRSLTMLSSHWYWEQDEQFRFTTFNGNARAGNWTPEPGAMGRRRWELPGLRPLRTTWDEHRATLEAHQPFRDLECVRVRPDEAPKYLSASGEPVFDEHGRFTGYRGTTRDITASKTAEERLRDAQMLLHIAARMGRLGAWAYQAGQERVTWSDELCALYEVEPGFAPTPEQVVGFFAPADQEVIRGTMAACLCDGTPFDVEARAITATGRERWIRVIGEAEPGGDARSRRIRGACQDVSESRRAAEESRATAGQLTTTLESLTDAFFTMDRQWRLTYVNAKAERLVGRRREELLGRNAKDEFPNPAAAPFFRHYQRALDENAVVEAEEYYAPAEMWVQFKVYPSAHGLAVYMKNVTDRVLAQRGLLRLNAELEVRVRERTAQLEIANRELEAFSYAIAHDLRAPLSAIEGFSDCLQRDAGPELGPRNLHYVSRIRAGVRHMRDLTGGLLSLASLSQASLRCKPVDLATFARATVAACQEGSTGRTVEVRIAETLPAHGDPRLLVQVIENLVGNAWKFTGRTDPARIEIGSMPAPGGGTAFFVRDNGAGFDAAYAAKLFEPFQRLHTQEEFEGTGIGLAIVHKVISLHGGRIWAESEIGQGASVFFTLG